MKKKIFFVCLLISFFVFTLPVNAEGKLAVEYENFIFTGDYFGEYYAKITNTGNSGTGVGNLNLEIIDTSGNTILTETWLGTCPFDAWLEPGESIYVWDFISDQELTREIGSFQLTIDSSSRSRHYTEIPCSYELYYDQDADDNAIFVTFTNQTDAMLFDFQIAAALYDQDDHLIFADYSMYYDLGAHPGGTFTAYFQIDSFLTMAYVREKIEPSRVEVHVWVEDD